MQKMVIVWRPIGRNTNTGAYRLSALVHQDFRPKVDAYITSVACSIALKFGYVLDQCKRQQIPNLQPSISFLSLAAAIQKVGAASKELFSHFLRYMAMIGCLVSLGTIFMVGALIIFLKM